MVRNTFPRCVAPVFSRWARQGVPTIDKSPRVSSSDLLREPRVCCNHLCGVKIVCIRSMKWCAFRSGRVTAGTGVANQPSTSALFSFDSSLFHSNVSIRSVQATCLARAVAILAVLQTVVLYKSGMKDAMDSCIQKRNRGDLVAHQKRISSAAE